MLGGKDKGILDKPDILKREASLEPVKKKSRWMFKLILVLIIAGLIYYLYTHPEVIRGPVDAFLGNRLK